MKRLLIFALLLALCLPLSGCLDAEDEEPEDFWELEEPIEIEEPAPEEPTVFTLPYLSSQSLNPITCSDGVQQMAASLLYEGLFTLDEHFVPQNALCSSYVKSGNGLSYTFTLRDGVVFTDGSALTPADVVSAYRRAQVSDRYAARFANITGIRAGRNTVILTLARADSALPALLDIPIIKSGTDKYPVPVGTGPYRFGSDEKGDCLLRNASWWGGGEGLPERIALAAAKDAGAAAYLFSANRAHLLTADLLSDSPAASIGGVELTDAPTTTLYYLGFNAKKGAATADRTLRAAMGAALDREAIIASLLANHADAARFPISPASALYPAEPDAPYNSAAYGEALDARVTGEPRPLALTLLVNEENVFKTALADYLAKTLSQRYVTVTVSALPWADYVQALEGKGFDLYLGEVRLTADWNVAPLVGTNGALNYGGFTDGATDAALAAFLANENETTAAALYARLAEEAPLLPIAFKAVSLLTPTDRIDGAAPTQTHPLNALENWTFHFDNTDTDFKSK